MKLKNTKLRQGDEVIVVSGREKGKRGNIKKIVGDKCIVNDLNLAKKHTRPNPQLGITGGIVEKEMPINLSNVMIWNSATKKKDKIAFKDVKGKKIRVFQIMKLREKYTKEIAPMLKEKLGFKSIMQVPKLEKITINMGVGEASKDKGVLEHAVQDLEAIAGQKVVVTRARKAVSTFKIREEYPIGCKVTLRGEKMYDFFERLVNLAIPREKDFRGLSVKSFDGRGNYNMGIKEQIIFPEIDYDKVDKLRGMDIAITTSATKDSDAKELLESFNFPFRGKNG